MMGNVISFQGNMFLNLSIETYSTSKVLNRQMQTDNSFLFKDVKQIVPSTILHAKLRDNTHLTSD